MHNLSLLRIALFRPCLMKAVRITNRTSHAKFCHPDPFDFAQDRGQRRISPSRGTFNLDTDPSPHPSCTTFVIGHPSALVLPAIRYQQSFPAPSFPTWLIGNPSFPIPSFLQFFAGISLPLHPPTNIPEHTPSDKMA